MTFRPWNGRQPTTIAELFSFYHEYVKVLYAYVQTDNSLPQEMLFEINAALDHLSRIWIFEEDEANAVSKAYSHFKRSCLDVFKLRVKEAKSQYNELLAIDTSGIDNGEFDRQLHELWAQIKKQATTARKEEGAATSDANAFALWEEVLLLCIKLETQFFEHARLPWAKRRSFFNAASSRFTGWSEAIGLSLATYWFLRPEQITYRYILFFIAVLVIAIGLNVYPHIRKRLFKR